MQVMGLLTPVAVQIGAISWMPKLLPQIVFVDKLIQSGTRGRLTILDVAGLPNLMLTVVGRKSGLPRSNPLLCVPYTGASILIAGSYFGGPKEPMWVKNVEANPEVTVRFKGKTSQMTARLLVEQDRADAWQAMLKTWPNFAKYEERTDRHIKVFQLLPQGAGSVGA
ncbi:MAG: putative nitroreductase [Frankiales bacterium]|nr:putative nitroreductase [Frankiales bacterium]